MITNMKKFNIDNQEDLKEFEKNLPKCLKPKKSKFNGILKKIDNTQFYITKKLILFFVKKSNFQKNKFKVMLSLKRIELGVFVVTVFMLTPIGLYQKSESESLGSFLAMLSMIFFVYSFLLLLGWFEYSVLQKKEVTYEPLFLLRKHPHVYKSIKLMVDSNFILYRRLRYSMIKMRAILLIPFYIVMLGTMQIGGVGLEDSYLLFMITMHFLMMVNDYIDVIFDFDKPKGKKKKATNALTNLAKKLFEEMSKFNKPLPMPV